MRTTEVGIRMAALGIRVIPCAGKAGVRDWSHRASLNPAQIAEWFDGRYASLNLGAIPGDGYVVVDLDSKKDGPANWDEVVATQPVPKTLTVLTPTGGRHLYFGLDRSVIVRTGYDFLAPGVDIWSGSHLLIAPPSIHPATRTPYQFAEPPTWDDPDLIADAPSWLLDRISQPVRRVREGRHPKLVAHAIKMRADGGLSVGEIVFCLRLLQELLGFCKPDRELLGIAQWAVHKIPFDPGRITDCERQMEAEGRAIQESLAATLSSF